MAGVVHGSAKYRSTCPGLYWRPQTHVDNRWEHHFSSSSSFYFFNRLLGVDLIDLLAQQGIAISHSALIRLALRFLTGGAVAPCQCCVQVLGLDNGEILATAIRAAHHFISTYSSHTGRSQYLVV